MRFILITLLFLFSVNAFPDNLPNGKLIFAIDVIRHGDRTPTEKIAHIPYPWKEGVGQLTAVGMQQEYQLGTKLRQKYITHFHLLADHYTDGTLYVRSSDVDRTLMSAQSFLMGLYPPGTGPYLPQSKNLALPYAYQPIPIHTVATEQDDLLKPRSRSPEFKKLLASYVYSTPAWQQKENELKAKFPAWSQATGIKIAHLDALILVGNALSIYQLYHIPITTLNQDDIQQMIDAGNWAYGAAFEPRVIGKELAGNLLRAITEYLQKAAASPTALKLKYVLFSAHDSTILSLMSALGVPEKESVGYAADLNFSLFKADGQYYVKISLNDRDVYLPTCQNKVCTLAQFEVVAPSIVHAWLDSWGAKKSQIPA